MRKLILLTVVLAAPSLFAQPALMDAVSKSFDNDHYILLPPGAKTDIPQTVQLTHDYFGEVQQFLETTPYASSLCAVLNLANASTRPARLTLAGADELRKRELVLCKSHPASKEQIAIVQQWYFPPPPTRRKLIAGQVSWPVDPAGRYADAVYFPPPATASAWLHGESKRDYRADVETDFNRDPLIAAIVCEQALQPGIQLTEATRPYQATLLDVCKAFPDAKIEAAFGVYKSEKFRGWLTGLMNSMLDSAAAMSSEARRQEANKILETLPHSPMDGTRNFEAAMRVIALAPDDFRGVMAVLFWAHQVSHIPMLSGEPADVKDWLAELYSKQMASGPESLSWKRGARGSFALIGRLDKATSIARELEATHDRDQHSLDVIYLASLERASGNPAAYEKMMANCPAPEAVYIAQHGAPSRPVKYCEDVVSEFARASRDALHGTPQATEFAKMAIETNRITPSQLNAFVVPANQPPTAPVPGFDDYFSALVHRTDDQVAAMTSVQRDETGYHLSAKAEERGEGGLETAIYLLMLRPWHEGGTSMSLRMAKGNPRLTTLIAELLEKRAATDIEWKRALRNYFLLEGNFARARELSRELMSYADPHNRDATLLGVTERILGDRKPLDEAIARCKGRSAQDKDYAVPDDQEKKSDTCVSMVVFNAHRAHQVAGEKVSPVYAQMLAQFARDPNVSWMIRDLAARNLTHIDRDAAYVVWRDLLGDAKQPDYSRQNAYLYLGTIAEETKNWREGMQWMEQYANTFLIRLHAFTPDTWRSLVDAPEGKYSQDEFMTMTLLRVKLAIGARDFRSAHRPIEDLISLGVCCNRAYGARNELLKLAESEIDAGQRQEPTRILGFLARQPLDSYLTSRLDVVRKKLGPVELKREETPWDTTPRPERLPKPPAQEPLKTSTSTT